MYFVKGVVIVVYHFRLIKKAAAPNELKVKVGSESTESKEFVSYSLCIWQSGSMAESDIVLGEKLCII